MTFNHVWCFSWGHVWLILLKISDKVVMIHTIFCLVFSQKKWDQPVYHNQLLKVSEILLASLYCDFRYLIIGILLVLLNLYHEFFSWAFFLSWSLILRILCMYMNIETSITIWHPCKSAELHQVEGYVFQHNSIKPIINRNLKN